MAIHVTRDDIIKLIGISPVESRIEPSFIGQLCIDILNQNCYMAYGLDYNNWVLLNTSVTIDNGGIDLSNLTAADISYNTDEGEIISVKQALDRLLYKNLVITDFKCKSGTNFEVGQILNSLIFEWSYNKKTIEEQSIIYKLDGVTKKEPLERNERSFAYHSAVSKNIEFKLEVTDGNQTINKILTIRFLNKGYWGVSKKPEIINASFVRSLQNNKLIIDRSMDITVDAKNDEYIYIALPKSIVEKTYAGEKNISFINNGFTGGFRKVGGESIIIVNNYDSNIVEEYYVYQSDNPGLGLTKISVR